MTKYLMYIYGGYVCICVPNMKFLYLILWPAEVCTDNDANADDDAPRRRMRDKDSGFCIIQH